MIQKIEDRVYRDFTHQTRYPFQQNVILSPKIKIEMDKVYHKK